MVPPRLQHIHGQVFPMLSSIQPGRGGKRVGVAYKAAIRHAVRQAGTT
jgi:hypothetical protein